VKIDQSLVKKAVTEVAARTAIASIAATALKAESYVIAEGVETVEILEFACRGKRSSGIADGIRGVQGYLLGRPSVGGFDLSHLHDWGKFLSAHFIKLHV
jgi:EAL domain-containing protein (putative c-di-GMP-specific phosphodiesterase class I)